MRSLPPLDTHAHVDPQAPPSSLENLGAVVLIATRSLSDFSLVRGRKDQVSIWGVGCHPNLVGAQRAFDAEQFEDAIHSTSYIAEVGLDGESRVPMERQQEVLRSILSITQRVPRIVSLHSYAATADVLSVLEANGPSTGKILHWWLGDKHSTQRALELGCYFSLNYSMVKSWSHLDQIPVNRILMETDHPSGDRFSSRPRQPGRVQDVEAIIARRFNLSLTEVRNITWRNFSQIVEDTGVANVLPTAVRNMAQFARDR